MSATLQTKLLKAPANPSLLEKQHIDFSYCPHLSLTIPSKGLKNKIRRRIMSHSLEIIMENKKTNYLLKILKRFHKTTSLKLDIAYNFKFNDADLAKFTRCIKSHFKKLQEFELSSPNAHSKLTNSGIAQLGKRISRLSKVTFDLSRLEKLDDTGVIALSKGLSQMRQALEFHLYISECENISDKGLISLAKSLHQHPELQKLTVSLLNCPQISKVGVATLANSIESLKNLTHLRINASPYIDQDTWTQILKNLENLQKLTHFGSKFEIRPVSDQRLSELSLSLSKLEKLRSLSLILLLCYEIKDDGLSEFCQNLTQIQTLKHLHFEIQRTEDLTDRGVERLTQHISQFKNLESLRLGFAFFTRLTNKGLMYLRELPKDLNRLSNLIFTFRSCDQIDNEGALSFSKKIYENSNIKEKAIDFSRCANISLGIQTETNAV